MSAEELQSKLDQVMGIAYDSLKSGDMGQHTYNLLHRLILG